MEELQEIHSAEAGVEVSSSGRASVMDSLEFGTVVLTSLLGLLWLLLITLNAGPLWRDELCSVMLAEERTVQDFWNNLGTDSSPLIWPTLLRVWISLGMTSDLQIRILGFLVGACLLGSLWLTAKWLGGGVPILSTSLLAFSPAFLFAVSSVRAYGVGSWMLICTIGLTWRVVERGSPARLAWLFVFSILAAHSLYTAAPFIFVILSSGIIVSAFLREWKTSMCVAAIGFIAAGSLLIYRHIIEDASVNIGLFQIPIDVPWILGSMRNAVDTAGPGHHRAWMLLVLVLFFSWLLPRFGGRFRGDSAPDSRTAVPLFCTITALGSFLFFGIALLRMKVPTQSWYYAPLMAVVAVAIDGGLGGKHYSRFFRSGRLIVALVLPLLAVSSVWQETQTRRTTMDIVARELMAKAGPEDLIVIDPFYLVTSFERYYHGKTPWMTVPPVADTRSGGYGFVKEAMVKDDSLAELFSRIGETFNAGHRVWVLGGVLLIPPQKLPPPPLPPPHGPLGWNHAQYSHYWHLQLGAFLLTHAKYVSQISTDPGMPVTWTEDVPLVMFAVDGGS